MPNVTVLPPWFKQKLPEGQSLHALKGMLNEWGLHTVCESARCPNLGFCWGKKTATFLILGDVCTRSCRFCAVKTGQPSLPEIREPFRVAQAVKALGLDYAVITSVTRDDLDDQGVGHFIQTIEEIRKQVPSITIEILIPDFSGRSELLKAVIAASPDVLSHNLETVSRLYPLVRPQADYRRSLEVLRQAKAMAFDGLVKSGFMVGLGERDEEIMNLMKDLVESGCDCLTIGQYLAPGLSSRHTAVKRFVEPDQFKRYAQAALEMGFLHVASGPLVRSSYRAEEAYQQAREARLLKAAL